MNMQWFNLNFYIIVWGLCDNINIETWHHPWILQPLALLHHVCGHTQWDAGIKGKCAMRLRWHQFHSPLEGIFLSNMRSLGKKVNELKRLLGRNRDYSSFSILCFRRRSYVDCYRIATFQSRLANGTGKTNSRGICVSTGWCMEVSVVPYAGGPGQTQQHKFLFSGSGVPVQIRWWLPAHWEAAGWSAHSSLQIESAQLFLKLDSSQDQMTVVTVCPRWWPSFIWPFFNLTGF